MLLTYKGDFMFGGGSGAGMAQVYRNNIKLLRKTNRFNSARTFTTTKKEYAKVAGGSVALKKISVAQLREIRRQVLQNRKQDRQKSVLISTAVFVPLLLLFAYVISMFFANENAIQANNLKLATAANLKHYNFYMSDAAIWLQQQKLANAIFQYRKAKELFPEKFAVNYKLTQVLLSTCASDSLYCEEAKESAIRLKDKYPDREEVLRLVAFLQD
ncbi:hypothetical protein H0I25_04005 [Cellulophaga sp. HaHa_2_95]|uniref:hypothetical protein n=1 Tax=unclassified Cellulophaga TaxID=2634405 RepID=UPI001C4F18FD|nr:hypothetical protein [Cellulophaga sp. HaHa_2_95]QXP56967.1 hypothetical protein H0I25_04005 [Cellulophaga sp. HaHa_2_95]